MSWYDAFNPLEWLGVNDAEDKAKNRDAQGEGLYSDNNSGFSQGWSRDPNDIAQGKGDVFTRDAGTTWEQKASALAEDFERRPDGSWTGGEDRGGYQYGRTATGADDAANLALQTGSEAAARGNALGAAAAAHGSAIEDANRSTATMVQNRVGPTGQWWQQDGALSGASSYGSQLAGLEAQQGPSAAQAQLQAGTNQALDSQIALARSGRGFGGNAAAAGMAQNNIAGIQANQANSAAQLAAQENAAWRGRQAANFGNAAGIQTAVGQQYGAQSQADLQAQLAARGQNDAAALGWAGQASDAWRTGMGGEMDAWKTGIGANLGAQGQATNVRGMEMQGGQALEDNKLRQWAAQNGYDLAQQQRSDQKDAATASAVGTIASTMFAASDVRNKTRIAPGNGAGQDFARGGEFGRFAYGGSTGPAPSAPAPQRPASSAVPETENDPKFSRGFDGGLGFDGTLYRPKRGMGGGESGAPAMAESTFAPEARPDTSKPFDTDTLDASALDAVRNSPASFYDYKDPSAPGADAQRHYGPMAQDLAKTPAGASAVVKQPDGSLGVDTGRLALVTTGAVSEQQKQLDAITAELEALRNKPSSVDPGAVYGGRR